MLPRYIQVLWREPVPVCSGGFPADSFTQNSILIDTKLRLAIRKKRCLRLGADCMRLRSRI